MQRKIRHSSPGIISLLFFIILLTGVHRSSAQTTETDQAIYSLESDQRSFTELLEMTNLGVPLTERLTRFCTTEVDSIRHHIMSDSSIGNGEKAKAIYSIGFFLHGMRQRLSFNKIEWYDMPDAIESYKKLLNALLYDKPYAPIIKPLSQLRTRLLAHAFEQYKEYDELIDLARYKSSTGMPDDIIKYLELHPEFRYFDSLLLFTAAENPVKLAGYLRHYSTELSKKIRSHPNIYVQQIVALSEDPNAADLMPFVVQLAEKKISKELILGKRTNAKNYFQLLVNMLKEFHGESRNQETPFHQALHNGIREKSLSFYVNQLNELHESPKDVRFASIKDLRMEDIYYIMTSSGDELYTSSYLGLYRNLMEYCKKNSTDSLFRIVHYDRFREFMRIAANYNTLSDFFSCFAEETTRELLKRYIDRIEVDTYTGLEKAMDVADCFAGLSADSIFNDLIGRELRSNFDRCNKENLIFGSRLYDILLGVYEIVQRKNEANGSPGAWSGYNAKLDRKKLQNKKGEVIGLVLFYGDEDGKKSFSNFRGIFKDPAKWDTEESPYWIRIRSRTNEPVVFYANLPLDHQNYLDIQAHDSLSAHLKEQGLNPVILVHRGHSYYINYTMRRMEESVMLAILGACGGNNYILDMAGINPDVQMVISKKIGAMVINDPIIAEISKRLVAGKDLVWEDIWNELENRFKSSPAMLTLFKEYISPADNISIFVMNLFNLDQ